MDTNLHFDIELVIVPESPEVFRSLSHSLVNFVVHNVGSVDNRS